MLPLIMIFFKKKRYIDLDSEIHNADVLSRIHNLTLSPLCIFKSTTFLFEKRFFERT